MAPIGSLDSPAAIERALALINSQDRGMAYKPPRMIVTLQKTAFIVNQRGSDEAVATYTELTGHIIAAKMTRAYYATKEQKVPTCSSRDGNIHGSLGRDLEADPGIPEGQLCASCPFNSYDPGLDAKGEVIGTRCKVRRNLLMLHADWEDPLIVSLARTSAPEWDSYAARLAKQKGAGGYISNITTIGIRTEHRKNNATDTYGIATFKAVDKVPMEDLVNAIRMREQFMELLGVVQPEPVAPTDPVAYGWKEVPQDEGGDAPNRADLPF